MAFDSYERIWRQILLHCPVASSMLARIWVNNAFRRIGERRLWSWLVREGQFISNQVVTVGTVSVTLESVDVVGVGTAFDDSMEGRQFRISNNEPLYTVQTVTDATNLILDRVFGGPSAANTGYEIFNALFTVPEDFHSFQSVWDPAFNWQLWTNVVQEELNAIDAQRSQSGTAWAVVAHSYDAVSSPPLPRYEIWPHDKSSHVWPFLYEARPIDLEDSGATLPRYIRGDVLLEMALEECARWPGPSQDQKNPYYSIGQAAAHHARAEKMIERMEVQDDEVYNMDMRIQSAVGMPFAPFPGLGDAAFLQKHSI